VYGPILGRLGRLSDVKLGVSPLRSVRQPLRQAGHIEVGHSATLRFCIPPSFNNFDWRKVVSSRVCKPTSMPTSLSSLLAPSLLREIIGHCDSKSAGTLCLSCKVMCKVMVPLQVSQPSIGTHAFLGSDRRGRIALYTRPTLSLTCPSSAPFSCPCRP
jgi:hypothetical protein